jgi:hypothetical protein
VGSAASSPGADGGPGTALLTGTAARAEAIGRALLAHAHALAGQLKSGIVQFTPDPAADALIREDPFAFCSP